MKRRYLAVFVILVLMVGPQSSSADPASWGQLAQIVAWLRQIDTVFEPVDSIKTEVAKLACNWRFTLRVEQLRLALFQGGSFCRRDWNSLVGASLRIATTAVTAANPCRQVGFKPLRSRPLARGRTGSCALISLAMLGALTRRRSGS